MNFSLAHKVKPTSPLYELLLNKSTDGTKSTRYLSLCSQIFFLSTSSFFSAHNNVYINTRNRNTESRIHSHIDVCMRCVRTGDFVYMCTICVHVCIRDTTEFL